MTEPAPITPELDRLIAVVPKAELHLHIEGTLEPDLVMALAARNGLTLPYASPDDLRAAYHFTRLQDFLDIYYAGAAVLREAEDFRDLAVAYFDRAAADSVRHAEIFFDPQTHTARGVPFGVVMDGLLAGIAEARQRHGMTVELILCFLRHLDEDAAFATLAEAEPWLDRIVGVGLDSSELGHPPAKFARVFARAGAMGLRRVAHAGEEGPAAYVREALDLLHVERIDHGNRALDDPALVERLAQSQMALTVCPLSNLRLCVVNDMRDHPLPAMLRAGLRATVNSDDPAYFGGYLNANFRALAAAGLIGRAEVLQLARNSFLGSFLPPDQRATHLAVIDALA